MDSSFSLEPLLEVFIFESSQLLEQLEQSVISGESTSDFSPALIDEIMRSMHTIKGSSAMMKFENIAHLSHSLEDLFYFLREDHPAIVDYSTLSDLVLEGCDFIKLEIYKIRNGDDPDGEASALIEKIEQFLTELKQENDTTQIENPMHTYNVIITFEYDCPMPNVRAFALVHQLEELVDHIHYYPEDIASNSDSASKIQEKGFSMWLQTSKTEEELYTFFAGTPFLKTIDFCQCEPASCLDDSSQISETVIRESVIYESSIGDSAIVNNLPKATTDSTLTQSSMISVQVGKLDKLMDLVGELVISEAMVTQNPELKDLPLEQFTKAARQLKKITSEIQDMVMSIRMVPLATTFHKMRRIVRDMCKKMNKDIHLEVIGEDTEVDKNIIERISDPLMHLIRNAVDHGIESPDDRETKGKNKTGVITLEARHVGSEVIIILKDDGKGLDRSKILSRARENKLLLKPEEEMSDKEVFGLIFLPGFSTKEAVTEFSGRGVGMDVVTRNLEVVGGNVLVESEYGQGTTITLRLPLTLAIIDGMNISVGQSRFTIPTVSIRESFRTDERDIITNPNGQEMLMVRGHCYPVLRLHKHYNISTNVSSMSDGIIIMVENERDTVCIFADQLLGEQQVVVKALPEYIRKVKDIRGLGGCTLLGDGSISLILDISGLLQLN
ncbi:chemotaxis protein CheA [Paenibacillus turicensis]|uniref:chemotaxis protein CheW n=1 Tax=Paenibacillus turicensis TaxID=160487 RepID=UPI003D29EC9D